MKEIWKDIHGFEGRYQISNMGRARSCDRITFDRGKGIDLIKKGKILSLVLGNGGYLVFNVHDNYIQRIHRVHRCVAKDFIENPENKYAINHKNGIKTDNAVSNLEWVTKSENEIHKHRVLGIRGAFYGRYGKLHPRSKEVDQFTLSGEFIKTWDCQGDIERELGFSQGNVSSCCLGKYKTAYGFIWKFKNKTDAA